MHMSNFILSGVMGPYTYRENNQAVVLKICGLEKYVCSFVPVGTFTKSDLFSSEGYPGYFLFIYVYFTKYQWLAKCIRYTTKRVRTDIKLSDFI